MPLGLKQKEQIVADINAQAFKAVSLVVTDYRRLTSSQMADLRSKARKLKVFLRVARITLIKRAFKGTPYECLNETLKGPVLLAFTDEEPNATARLVRDFAKENKDLEVVSLSLGGKVIDSSQLNAVAELPNKEEAIAKLLSVMQAPIAKFVRTLAEPHAKLVRTIAAVRDKKQAEKAA